MNAVEALIAAAGRWRGTNTLQDPFSGRPEASPSAAEVTPILGGRFARIDYTWAYQGAPQEGSLLVGFDPKTGEGAGHWIDTWHMGRAILACKGAGSAGGAIALRGSYPAPEGPDWGWRIEVIPGPDALRIVHTNIEPDGTESRAVEGVYERA